MADLKISQLTNATTPLTGAEVVPLVQSGVTKKVAVSDLTAGRNVSMNAVTFPATQVPSADPNTLDDYEEGTWTPNQGGGLTVVGAFSSGGTYTKIGRLVTVNFYFAGATSVAAAAGGNLCTNLPFTAASANSHNPGTMVNNALSAGAFCAAERNTTNVWAASAMAATSLISCSITYPV